jgi:hypothetical protein
MHGYAQRIAQHGFFAAQSATRIDPAAGSKNRAGRANPHRGLLQNSAANAGGLRS